MDWQFTQQIYHSEKKEGMMLRKVDKRDYFFY